MKRLLRVGVLALLGGCQPAAPKPGALGLPPLAAQAASGAQVELGRQLFMDRRLSRNGTMACAMCHIPEQGFAAVELGTSVGIEGRSLRRNAPTLLNVGYVGRLFHDGRSASLEQQAWDPLLNPMEMGNPDSAGVIARIVALPDYGGKFEAAFGGRVASRETVAAALAAYQRTLVSADSRFDRWLYGKDANALTQLEQAGFAVFAGKGRCIACHAVGERDALFSDGRFHNTGIGWAREQAASTPTRRFTVQLAPGVATTLQASDLASVSEPAQSDQGRFEVTQHATDRWAYRTPGLRNVALTPPYMHDGSLATLEDVIAFYRRGGIGHPAKSALLQPVALTEDEARSLAAFLRSLTGDNAALLARQARSGAGR